MRRRPFAPSLALALVVSAAGCSPEVPAAPTYTKDVQPILAAHCVRCHDETFRSDPVARVALPMPQICHLNRFESTGDCTSGTGACSYGAQICAPMIGPLVTASADAVRRMPPAPSDPLNDWEKEVITRWAANPLP